MSLSDETALSRGGKIKEPWWRRPAPVLGVAMTAVLCMVLIFGVLPQLVFQANGGVALAPLLDALEVVISDSSGALIGLAFASLAAAFTGMTVIALRDPEAVSRPKRESFMRVVEIFRLLAAFLATFPVVGAIVVFLRRAYFAAGQEGSRGAANADITVTAIENLGSSLLNGLIGVLVLMCAAAFGESLSRSKETDRRILETEIVLLRDRIIDLEERRNGMASRRRKSTTASAPRGNHSILLVVTLYFVWFGASALLAVALAVVLTSLDRNWDLLPGRISSYVAIELTMTAAFSVCWLVPSFVVRSTYWHGIAQRPPRDSQAVSSAPDSGVDVAKGGRVSILAATVLALGVVAWSVILWIFWIVEGEEAWWVRGILSLFAAGCVTVLLLDRKHSIAALIRENAFASVESALAADRSRLEQMQAEHAKHLEQYLPVKKANMVQRFGLLFRR